MRKEEIDLVFKALADPTRREILDQLRDGPRTTGVLCERFEMSRFGVMKHLKALEDAKLVTVEWRGRERWNYLNAYALQKAFERWIKPYESLWASKLDSFKKKVEGERNE